MGVAIKASRVEPHHFDIYTVGDQVTIWWSLFSAFTTWIFLVSYTHTQEKKKIISSWALYFKTMRIIGSKSNNICTERKKWIITTQLFTLFLHTSYRHNITPNVTNIFFPLGFWLWALSIGNICIKDTIIFNLFFCILLGWGGVGWGGSKKLATDEIHSSVKRWNPLQKQKHHWNYNNSRAPAQLFYRLAAYSSFRTETWVLYFN